MHKRLYETLFNSTSDAILINDPEGEGKVLSANPAACRMFRYTPQEFLGIKREAMVDLSDPKTAAVVKNRDGKQSAFEELLYIRKDGTRFYGDINRALFQDGKQLLSVVIIRDITERKRTEELLRESRDQAWGQLKEIESIYNSAHIGLAVFDRELRYVRINEFLAKINGFPAIDHIGKTVREILPDLGGFAEAIGRTVFITQQPVTGIEFSGTTPAQPGVQRFWTEHWLPLKDQDDQVVGINVVVEEITEQRRMEKELRRSRDELEMLVKERTEKLEESEKRLRILASELINAQEKERKRIAHELHDSLAAQLAAIKYRLERKLKEGDSPDRTTTLEQIIQDVQRATTETRRIMLNLRPSVLDDIGIVAALSWFSRETERTYPGMKVHFLGTVQEEEIPEGLKINIFRVIQECISNAIRHGRSNRVMVNIDKKYPWLRLSVMDNGYGFDSLREEPSEAGGIGLGSMQQRVESSGGIFSITSNPGKGTVVKAEWRIH